MRGRVVFTALLTLIFCLTVVFPISAAQQPSAKDLVLLAVKNISPGADKGFYEKSTGKANLEVTRFGGSLREELGDYTGATIRLTTQLDDSKNAIKISYDTDIKGIVADGDIYLKDDQVILTKDLFYLLRDFGVDPFENSNVSLLEAPEYLYLVDPQLKSVWEQLASYQSQQLPEEYTELLLFLVEAIPDEYFNLSATKVTIKLDQVGLVDTIVNLLTKMTNESDRAVEILVSANQHSFEQMGLDPTEMKREMAAGLEAMTVPSREEIKAMTSLVQVKDFTYEYSLLPGGPKKFNMDIGFNAPDGSVDGSFNIAVDTQGKQGNLEGTYRMAGNYKNTNGPVVDVAIDSKYSYKGTRYHSDMIINVVAKDNETGELMLDLGLVSDSVSEVDTTLVLKVPELSSNNSLDITELMSASGTTSMTVEQPGDRNLNLVVNGVDLDAKLSIGERGEMTLPARVVLEQLGYQVEWVEPDEIQVVSYDKAISLFINQHSYTVNDVEKNLTMAPYLEDDRTILPLSFIITEIGANLDFAERYIMITN